MTNYHPSFIRKQREIGKQTTNSLRNENNNKKQEQARKQKQKQHEGTLKQRNNRSQYTKPNITIHSSTNRDRRRRKQQKHVNLWNENTRTHEIKTMRHERKEREPWIRNTSKKRKKNEEKEHYYDPRNDYRERNMRAATSAHTPAATKVHQCAANGPKTWHRKIKKRKTTFTWTTAEVNEADRQVLTQVKHRWPTLPFTPVPFPVTSTPPFQRCQGWKEKK